MIINTTIPKQYELFSEKYSLQPWQQGVVSEIFRWNGVIKSNIKLTLDKNLIKSINMGPQAGHTYLARVLSLTDFPVKSKIYVTNTLQLGEYGDLVLKPYKCHEVIDVLYEDDFPGYHGNPVDLVVIDFDNRPVSRFQNSLNTVIDSLPITTLILLLHNN